MQEDKQIERIRKNWRQKLVILGHHYQRASVLRHADYVGDSLELAQKAAASTDAQRIVFCGVKFMAETADILTRDDQVVYMPDTSAGCPMANMADAAQMMKAWAILQTAGNDWLPVVYVNSTAEVKAQCGALGGSACTSSNARKVIQWVFSQGKRVFFLPDEHLGVNTAAVMGIPDGEVAVYDPKVEGGGLTTESIAASKIVVWRGFCLVHTAFKVNHVEEVRRLHPDAKIIVHPETPKEVLRLCDAHGSTSQIIKYVETMPEGSTVVIGTENSLVERLAEQYRGKLTIKALSPSVCANMAKTNEVNLLDLLTKWPGSNQICVDEQIAPNARKCLERMLRL
jgi:quinolinate synthase